MLYVGLGSSEDIGASCHYLKINDTGIMLDSGMDPEEEGVDALPEFALIDKHPDWPLDHVLITHAHHDHIGSLPVLVQRQPHVKVHMTKPTRRLVDILLPASAKLQRRRVLEGSTTAAPLFTREQAEALSYVYLAHDLDTPFDLPGLDEDPEFFTEEPAQATFYHAGHVLGAAGVFIEFEEDNEVRSLFYTSDTNLRKQTIHPGGDYPEGPIDILLLESTLGADPTAELTNRQEQERLLGEAIKRTLKRGGNVLLPVFALGRAQEIIALIGQFKDDGLIPADTPVYTNGSMRAIADVYDKTRHISPRVDEEFEVYGVSQKRVPRNNDRLPALMETPSIFVAASGMLFERTLSNVLALRLMEEEKNGIFFVGYAKEDSPAYLLHQARQKGAGTEVTINKLYGPKPVRAEVDKFRLSGHSHRRDLLKLVEQMKPKKVVLVHGETPARDWMADNIRYFHPEIEVYSPKQGEAITV